MNSTWIIIMFVINCIFAIAGAAALYLVASTRDRMRRQQKCHLAESLSMRESIAALEEKLEDKLRQVSLEAKQVVPPPVASTPFSGLDVQKRAEAIRMYRHGSDRETISTALGLKPAEVALLQKVHLLSRGAA